MTSNTKGPLTSTSTVLKNFDWVDIETGTGIVEYNGFGITASGATLSALDKRDTVFSYPNMSRAVTTTSYVKIFDLDFDGGELTNTQILKGTMMAEIPFTWSFENGGVRIYGYVKITLKKLLADGTTEVDIATESSAVISRTNSTLPIQYYSVTTLEVPRTAVKVGEKIRVNLECYTKHTGDGAGFGVCYEPANTAISATDAGGTHAEKLVGVAGFTQMRIAIPYEIPE